MDIVEVEKLNKYRKLFIGIGTSATIYRIDKYHVAKIFFNYFREDYEKEKEHFELLLKVSNDSFIGPSKLLVMNGIVVGYIYPYVEGKTLHRIRNNITIQDILKNYDKLILDTDKISDLNFRLYDLHGKNILYYKDLKIIDLDRGYKNKYNSIPQLHKSNIASLNKAIIDTLFKVFQNEIINFRDDKLNELYYSLSNPDNFVEFLELTQKKSETTEKVKYKKIRKNINYYKELNDYYHH